MKTLHLGFDPGVLAAEVENLRRVQHENVVAYVSAPGRPGAADESSDLDVAYRLFADGGYARTTIAAVADTAGVSPETIYLTFGGKRGLLEGVIEMAIAPEVDPSTQEDELWKELAQVPEASLRLEAMVEYCCAILARTGSVHAVIRGAADKEPFAARPAAKSDGADRALSGLRPQTGPVDLRGGRTVFRTYESRALLASDCRVRLDCCASPKVADQLARVRAPRFIVDAVET